MLEHGGRIQQVASLYPTITNWLDLSTGINPQGWPVPALPDRVWQRLPEPDDGLEISAQNYYHSDSFLTIPGSQSAIQLLPALRSKSRVGIIAPTYAEHHYCWQKAGHDVLLLNMSEVEQQLDQLDVLVVVNPNNPTGTLYWPSKLLEWHHQLKRRKGWLIVDEAFIDTTPDFSLLPSCPQPRLIVLRSLGKFFGLAGLRLGFVFAEPWLLKAMQENLGPWPIAAASRYIAREALSDTNWQHHMRHQLLSSGEQLRQLLTQYGLTTHGGCALFQWCQTQQARLWHDSLCEQGILTRLFRQPDSLRFGLPANEQDWLQLETQLAAITRSLS